MKAGLKKDLFLFFFLASFSAFLLFLDKSGWLKPTKSLVQKPILWAGEKIYGFKQVLFAPTKETLRLQSEVRRLAVEQNQLSICQEENEKMKKLLGAPLPLKWKFLPAKVIGFSEKMRINKGLKDGVKPGMMVVWENILVGRITEANNEDSFLQLPVTLGVKIPVEIRRPQASGVQARGLTVGQNGRTLILDWVLQQEDIKRGDLVMTSGEADWSAGLLIGSLTEVLPPSAAIYRKAKIEPLVDYRNLTLVFVVIKE